LPAAFTDSPMSINYRGDGHCAQISNPGIDLESHSERCGEIDEVIEAGTQ
jgi:hypothetical protein